MSKHIIVFLIFLNIFSYKLYSQNEVTYYGTVMLTDSTLITYRIILKEKNGDVSGYSITDLGGDHETRSNILGEYDNSTKELNFRETDIVYTKSEVTTYDFCFINSTIKNFKFGKTKKIKSPFLGFFSDNTECINGELLLVEEEKVKKLYTKASKIIQKSKKLTDSVKQASDPIKNLEEKNKNILKKGQVLNVFTTNSYVDLYIYDSGEVDNDKIELKVNSKTYFKEFTARKEKEHINIPLKTIVTAIDIKALNEGDIGKNTVRVLIKDGSNKTIRVLTSLNKNDLATVKIHKL